MTITLSNFPSFPIRAQLFTVNSFARQGGFTLGGSRVYSPDPSGVARLHMTPSLIRDEPSAPLASWFMSNVSGEVMIVKLNSSTPQIASAKTNVTWDNNQPWDNNQHWTSETVTESHIASDISDNTLHIVTSELNIPLQKGHLIGHRNNCYLIDKITSIEDNNMTVVVKPPLRSNVGQGDTLHLSPWFTGVVVNPDSIRDAYSAVNMGKVTIPEIQFREYF